jgi:hypothetical protein
MFAFCVCSPAASDAMLYDDTARLALPAGMQSTAHNTYQQRRESHRRDFAQLHSPTVRRDQHQVGCCQSAKRRPECLTAPLLRLHAASRSTVRVAGPVASRSYLAQCTSICRYLDVGPPC